MKTTDLVSIQDGKPVATTSPGASPMPGASPSPSAQAWSGSRPVAA